MIKTLLIFFDGIWEYMLALTFLSIWLEIIRRVFGRCENCGGLEFVYLLDDTRVCKKCGYVDYPK